MILKYKIIGVHMCTYCACLYVHKLECTSKRNVLLLLLLIFVFLIVNILFSHICLIYSRGGSHVSDTLSFFMGLYLTILFLFICMLIVLYIKLDK